MSAETDEKGRFYLDFEIHECWPGETASLRVYADSMISGLFFNQRGEFVGHKDRHLKNVVVLRARQADGELHTFEVSMESWLNAVIYTLMATPLIESDPRLVFIEQIRTSIIEEDNGFSYLQFHNINLRKGRPD